jgi:hypothetical protein
MLSPSEFHQYRLWQYSIFLHQSETVPFDTLLPVLWIAAVVAIVAVLPVTQKH